MISFLLCGILISSLARDANAETPVSVLVLKENGIGSSSKAQPFIDRFMEVLAKENGWAAAQGKFFNRRKSAEKWVDEVKANYGIMSLSAFLALRSERKLKVIGKAEVVSAGERQYHVVGEKGSKLETCFGQKLASNHLKDRRFIERVVLQSGIRLDQVELFETRRPIQTLKAVVRGEAKCALIDDAQLDALKTLEGGDGLASLWSSKKMPPMVVVAFPSVSEPEQKQFKKTLGKLCQGAAQSVCVDAGLRSLSPAKLSEYQPVIRAYGD